MRLLFLRKSTNTPPQGKQQSFQRTSRRPKGRHSRLLRKSKNTAPQGEQQSFHRWLPRPKGRYSLFVFLFAVLAQAQSGEVVAKRLDDLDKSVKAAQSSADNAWMLVSAALVLMMTGPGLALFYGGLVRRKNTLAIMMQSFALMALITVMWALVGYSLCFGGDGHFIGSFEHAFLRGVGADPNPDYSRTIPQLTFMVYQLMFAIITPALITGATAERMKFSGTVLFLTLWFLVVYAPLAHMVWGKGGLLNASLGGKFPTLDFAGGTVVHISSGVSALVCALYLGKRTGYPKQPMPPP